MAFSDADFNAGTSLALSYRSAFQGVVSFDVFNPLHFDILKKRPNYQVGYLFFGNRHIRDCAPIIDFPEQLCEIVKLDLTDLPDLSPLIQMQMNALKTVLNKRGITSWEGMHHSEENSGQIRLTKTHRIAVVVDLMKSAPY